MSEGHEKSEKFRRQERLYKFPYHYIPHFDDQGVPSRQRFLRWGLEYLCYMAHIAQVIDEIRPVSLLDVGCGEGRLFSLVNEDIERRVGVDLAERSVRFARAFNPDVDFVVGAVNDIDAEFETVTAIEVLEHIPDSRVPDFVRGLIARLKPEGQLIVSVPSSTRPVEAKHFRHYSEKMLVETVIGTTDELTLIDVEHLYEEPKWVELWKRMSSNRFWKVEISIVRRFMWDVIWNSRRKSDAARGRHIVARFVKA